MTDTPTTWLPSKDGRQGYTTIKANQDASKLLRPELKEQNMTGTNPWADSLPAVADNATLRDHHAKTKEWETNPVAVPAEAVALAPRGPASDAFVRLADELADEHRELNAKAAAEILGDEIYVPAANHLLASRIPIWTPPNVRQLPRVDVPDSHAYFPHITAWLATGQPARDAADLVPIGATVAMDTETDGLGADGFTVKCFTAAWETSEGTASVLLDPSRRDDDRTAVRKIMDRAGLVVFHNAAFDVPIMYQNGLLGLDQISKVHDTAVYARMAFPDRSKAKSLEVLSVTLAEFPEAEVTMAAGPFKANGWAAGDGWRLMDIDRPIYRLGAMADTVATLRLLPAVQAATWSTLVEGHPFADMGVDSDGALALMEREQRVNRIMLRRSAIGLQVDTDYLATYEDLHARDLTAARDAVVHAGLDPEAGNLGFLLVSKLDAAGELPANWPRTPGGQLRATKDDLPLLDHPLAASVRKVDELTKISGYLTKVADMVRVTGRVHPQVTILGASATGRMSYSWPELQQFPADARPIIVSDSGLTSVDWSQIEPVVMANCAGDADFLAPFEAGEDLYGPIQAAAGVPRKVAKVLLLAAMYGQGAKSMATDLSKPKATGRLVTEAEAKVWRDGMFQAMPTTRGFIDQLRAIGETHGQIPTADGRILTVPKDPKTGQRLAYKAVNYFCQGSAYSVLADTLIRMEDAGLADSVHLALHDELVVDTEAAEAVAEVMRTPPDFLLKWTKGRVPVFKTDTHDMGRTWLYV